MTVAADLLERDECKRLVDEHVKAYGRVDILVNNAGRQVVCQRHEDINLDEVEKTCVAISTRDTEPRLDSSSVRAACQ